MITAQNTNHFTDTDNAPLLLSNIAQGNEQAMELFFKSHQGRVLAYAKSRLHHYEDALEVVNEVMFEVWRSAKRFKNESKVSTWLISIAHHKVVDKIRKLQRTQAEPFNEQSVDEDQISGPDSLGSDALLERYQDQQLVKLAMQTLNQEQQQVMYLSFYKGLGYPEIAKILGCPEGTVKTRVMHAKRKIKTGIERMNQY